MPEAEIPCPGPDILPLLFAALIHTGVHSREEIKQEKGCLGQN